MEIENFFSGDFDLRAINLVKVFDEAANSHFESLETEEGNLPVDYFEGEQVDWFDEKFDLLDGKTPREYIEYCFGEKPTFETSLEIMKPFVFDEMYDVPSEIKDIVLQHKEELVNWTIEILDACTNITDEDEESTFALNSLFMLFAELDDKVLVEKFVEFYKNLDYSKMELIAETLAMILSSTDTGIDKVLEIVNNSEEPTMKEFTLISSVVSIGAKSDEVYRTIRSFCKRSTGDIVPDCYYLFKDYGDQRAVSYLRTLAKKYQELAIGAGPDVEKNRQIYFSLLSIIESLGGNTADFD